jgi:hypothetical protein
LTLKLHPLCNYLRNEVTEVLTDNSPPFDGIVEEHVLDRNDLLKPSRFFGYDTPTLKAMMMVYRDIRTFIDTSRIKTYLVNDYLFKWPY